MLPAEPAYQVPERVAARLIWWDKRPADGGVASPTDPWFKEGVDVLISGAPGTYLLVWSTSDSRLINDTNANVIGSAVEALLSAVQTKDTAADISTGSVLSFDREAYLWLTNAAESKKSIGHGVMVTDIAGMGTDEGAGLRRLSGKLDGRVNFDRIGFISALGSGTDLSPAEITFMEKTPAGKVEHTSARLTTTGGAKSLLSRSHYSVLLTGAFKREGR